LENFSLEKGVSILGLSQKFSRQQLFSDPQIQKFILQLSILTATKKKIYNRNYSMKKKIVKSLTLSTIFSN